jgi:hypothetical protein
MMEEPSQEEFEAILADILDMVKTCAFCGLHATECIRIPYAYTEAINKVLEQLKLRFLMYQPEMGDNVDAICVVYTTGVSPDRPLDPAQE